MNDIRSVVKQMTLAEARLWLAYCMAAGIVYFTIKQDHEAASSAVLEQCA